MWRILSCFKYHPNINKRLAFFKYNSSIVQSNLFLFIYKTLFNRLKCLFEDRPHSQQILCLQRKKSRTMVGDSCFTPPTPRRMSFHTSLKFQVRIWNLSLNWFSGRGASSFILIRPHCCIDRELTRMSKWKETKGTGSSVEGLPVDVEASQWLRYCSFLRQWVINSPIHGMSTITYHGGPLLRRLLLSWTVKFSRNLWGNGNWIERPGSSFFFALAMI